MKQLSSNLKINVLKGLSNKMRSNPMKDAEFIKEPKMPSTMSARTQRETNPDYFPRRKTPLTGKLF